MGKSNDSDVEDEPKDEQTAKFLHKIAENGKTRGIPESLVAQYEKKSWEVLKCEEKHTTCEKCGMPPPPPFESAKKSDSEPSEVCRNCGTVNEKPIAMTVELVDLVKKSDEKKSLKRSSNSNDSATPAPPKRQMYEPPRNMARKVAPQPKFLSRQQPSSSYMPPTAPKEPPTPPTPLTLAKSSKKKKAKVQTASDPDFLQKLFGIGANPV